MTDGIDIKHPPHLRALGVFAILLLAVLFPAHPGQAAGIAWSAPALITSSDTASRPSVAISPDGTIHAIWWDAKIGEMYSHTRGGANPRWLTPAPIPAIAAGKPAVAPPLGTRLVAGATDIVHAFWYTAGQELNAVTYRNNAWGPLEMIAAAAADMDAYSDISGTVHLAYVRTVDRPGSPAGVYYRASTEAGWTPQQVILSSPLFLTAVMTDTDISIAGDASGRLVVAWQVNGVIVGYARSIDRGVSWQTIPSLNADQPSQAQLPIAAAFSAGEFVMLWRSADASSCALTQRRSSDGGETWDAPQTALTGAAWCSLSLSLTSDDQNRLWLLGTPLRNRDSAPGALGTALALWDRTAWFALPSAVLPASPELDSSTDIPDCRDIALNSALTVVVGCNSSGDIWVVRSTQPLAQITSATDTPTPTLTPVATATPLPTATPPPTQTPSPTPTRVPTRVPTATPSPTPSPTATAMPTPAFDPNDPFAFTRPGLNLIDILFVVAALIATGLVVIIIHRLTHPSSATHFGDDDT